MSQSYLIPQVLRILAFWLLLLTVWLTCLRQSPAQSPWIVFQSERAGNQWDLFLLQPSTGRLEQVTDTPTLDERMPTWSPDGRWLAYEVQSESFSAIYKQRLWGGDRQRVSRSNAVKVASLRWSPDGQWFAFYDRTNNHIYRMPSAGGPAEALRPITHYFPDSGVLDWSPDSQRIVYTDRVATAPQVNALHILDLQTRQATRLTQHENTDMTPLWGAEDWIFFSSYTRSGYELFRISADGSDQTRLTTTAWDELYSHLSPDGEWLVAASWQPRDLELYQMRPDGTQRQRLTESPGQDYAPNWSPIINFRWQGLGMLLIALGLGGLAYGFGRTLA